MNPQTKIYTCIIADDNDFDRLTLLSYARRYSFIQIGCAFESSATALVFVQKNEQPGILFAGIDMAAMNGLDVREELQKIPACMIVTAHPEFAGESFEMAAIDYIVKYTGADRLQKAMQRLQHFVEIHFKAELLNDTHGEDTLFIKDGHNHIKLKLHEIIYPEALKDDTGIVTGKKKYCVLTPLDNLNKENAFQTFIRIPRSHTIQSHFIKQISTKEVMVSDTLLPVGRNYKKTVENLLTQ